MADWHLEEIRRGLKKAGWRIVAEHPGDEYRLSATWEIARDRGDVKILIDFDGLDDMDTLPVEKSYGCAVRGSTGLMLYFPKKGMNNSPPRHRWTQNLGLFIDNLGNVEPEAMGIE
jgi:hypothetical protein